MAMREWGEVREELGVVEASKGNFRLDSRAAVESKGSDTSTQHRNCSKRSSHRCNSASLHKRQDRRYGISFISVSFQFHILFPAQTYASTETPKLLLNYIDAGKFYRSIQNGGRSCPWLERAEAFISRTCEVF